MISMNKFIAIGRLGQDIELRYTAGGDAVANFSLALSDDYKDAKNTYWPRFSVFGKQAETLQQYTKKGDRLAVVAKFTERKYTDKQGQERNVIEFRLESFELLGARSGQQESQQPSGRASQPQSSPSFAASAPKGADEFDDDIPF